MSGYDTNGCWRVTKKEYLDHVVQFATSIRLNICATAPSYRQEVVEKAIASVNVIYEALNVKVLENPKLAQEMLNEAHNH